MSIYLESKIPVILDADQNLHHMYPLSCWSDSVGVRFEDIEHKIEVSRSVLHKNLMFTDLHDGPKGTGNNLIYSGLFPYRGFRGELRNTYRVLDMLGLGPNELRLISKNITTDETPQLSLHDLLKRVETSKSITYMNIINEVKRRLLETFDPSSELHQLDTIPETYVSIIDRLHLLGKAEKNGAQPSKQKDNTSGRDRPKNVRSNRPVNITTTVIAPTQIVKFPETGVEELIVAAIAAYEELIGNTGKEQFINHVIPMAKAVLGHSPELFANTLQQLVETASNYKVIDVDTFWASEVPADIFQSALGMEDETQHDVSIASEEEPMSSSIPIPVPPDQTVVAPTQQADLYRAEAISLDFPEKKWSIEQLVLLQKVISTVLIDYELPSDPKNLHETPYKGAYPDPNIVQVEQSRAILAAIGISLQNLEKLIQKGIFINARTQNLFFLLIDIDEDTLNRHDYITRTLIPDIKTKIKLANDSSDKKTYSSKEAAKSQPMQSLLLDVRNRVRKERALRDE